MSPKRPKFGGGVIILYNLVLYVQEDHHLTSCSSALFHACGHLEKVCSSPLCASDVQYSQEFYTPGQYIRDLNCCAAKSWLLCLISPTPCSFHHCIHQGFLVLKSNEPTNSLWWLSWSRSYQMIVPDTRISSVPHPRQNSSERVCGTKYHTLNWQWVCSIPHTLKVSLSGNATRREFIPKLLWGMDYLPEPGFRLILRKAEALSGL